MAAEAGPRTPPELRVVDAGTVDPWRSQALWHGIATAMDGASPPTLSFCRPAAPYVGLGYHCSVEEIDLELCRRRGLPVIRRQLGGGPVYVDSDQLFFQITVPAGRAPARVERLYELYLEPAAAAFRALGLDARRNGWNDLAAGRRKLSGTAAGRIGDGVVVVGNVIFRFPHRRMAEILALPTAGARRECLRLMERHVSSLEAEGRGQVGREEARGALVAAYAAALGGRPRRSALTGLEEAAIRRWEERFRDPAWLAGPPAPPRPARRVKISADAAVVAAAGNDLEVEASIVDGRFERLALGSDLGAEGEAIARALAGRSARAETLAPALAPFGEAGRRVLAVLEPGLGMR